MAQKTDGNFYGNVQLRLQPHNDWTKTKRGTRQRRKPKPLKCLFNFLADYCKQSSLHGLKYLVEPGTHWIERVVWAFLFTLSVMTTIIVICKLSSRFQNTHYYSSSTCTRRFTPCPTLSKDLRLQIHVAKAFPGHYLQLYYRNYFKVENYRLSDAVVEMEAQTSTVVETTNYPVSNLPFPSVTLCPSNRVDWQKALEMEKDIVPTHDQEAVQTYRDLVTTLSTITFGDFDKLGYLKNRSLEAFHDLNLMEFLRKIAPKCSELLSDCWWRDSDRNCCEIFEPQRTEYGLCYSFNSETADYDEVAYSKELRPRRSNLMGDWTGIRFTVKLNKSNAPPETDKAIGVTTFIGHPNSWPSNGRNSAIGMLASIPVQCPSTYATSRVLELQKNKLPCQPPSDDGTNYNQDYCLTLCRRRYTIMRCGCNPSFMMPKGSAPECTVQDLICLINENAFFNKYVLRGNPFFPDNDLGMNCSCPPQCEFYDYRYQITHTELRESIATNTIFIDVHYESSTMMRYRMDIVYTQLDLLVSFGGIVGLFLGGSILSLMELLYYVVIGLIGKAFRRSKTVCELVKDPKYVKSHFGFENPIPTVHKVLPLMDYYPNQRGSVRRY